MDKRSVSQWEKDNDYSSYEEWYDKSSGIPQSEVREKKANPNMHCKTCKYADKRYNGKPLKSVLYPNWMAGTCEMYQEKPSNVYFKGEKCPKYEAK